MTNKNGDELAWRKVLPRLPGQYDRYKAYELAIDGLYVYLSALFFVLWALVAWIQYFYPPRSAPWLLTVFAVAVAIFAFLKVRARLRDAQHHALGAQGEVLVGQLLEGLRPFGYTPMHDVPCVGASGKAFNIDHVLVGPTGVFCIETKAWTRRNKNDSIGYASGSLTKADHSCGAKEIMQAADNARWLRDLLLRRLGSFEHEVTPILTFPRWYIESSATSAVRSEYGVLLLTPKAIGKYLGSWERRLSDAEIQTIVTSLASYVYEQAEKEV